MKKYILTITALLITSHLAFAAPLKVVVTIPDIADIAGKVGGDEVEIYTLASGREDPHNVPIKPSAILKLAQADLFIQIGLELEHAYAPAMLQESRNQKIKPGGPGFFDLSRGVTPLDVPKSVDRAEGDLHPNGSPHYNLDPIYGQVMARNIALKLSQMRPERSAYFKKNANDFMIALREKMVEWRSKLSQKKRSFISYHPYFTYFNARFGTQQVGTIQPKPGIEPGPQHIASLTEKMKASGTDLILKESFYSDRIPNRIAQMTGAKVVTIPILVNGTPEAKDYISLIDTIVNAIVE